MKFISFLLKTSSSCELVGTLLARCLLKTASGLSVSFQYQMMMLRNPCFFLINLLNVQTFVDLFGVLKIQQHLNFFACL